MFHCFPFKKLGTEIVNTQHPFHWDTKAKTQTEPLSKAGCFPYFRNIRRLLVRHAYSISYQLKNDNLCPIKAVISIH